MANPTAPPPQATEVGTLSDGTRIMKRAPRIRSCGLKDEKGKLCAGHLKRWFYFGEEIKLRFGEKAEIYRCEKCKTLYLPNDEEPPRTGTLCW